MRRKILRLVKGSGHGQNLNDGSKVLGEGESERESENFPTEISQLIERDEKQLFKKKHVRAMSRMIDREE